MDRGGSIRGESGFKGRRITFCLKALDDYTEEPLGTSQAASHTFPFTSEKLQAQELAGPRLLPSLLLCQTDTILSAAKPEKKAVAQKVFTT